MRSRNRQSSQQSPRTQQRSGDAAVMVQTWRNQMAVREAVVKTHKDRLPGFMGVLPMSKGRGLVPLAEFSLMSVVPVRTRTDVYCIRGSYDAANNEIAFDQIVMQHNLLIEPGDSRGRQRHQLLTLSDQADWLQSALITHDAILRAAAYNSADLPPAPTLPRFLLGFPAKAAIPFADTQLLRVVAAESRGIPASEIDVMPAETRQPLLEEMFQGYITAPGGWNRTGLFLIDHALLGNLDLSAIAPPVLVDCRDAQGMDLPHPLRVRGEVLLFADVAEYPPAPSYLSDPAGVRAWATATDEELLAAVDISGAEALRAEAQQLLDRIIAAAQKRLPDVSREHIRGAYLAGHAWVGPPVVAGAVARIRRLRELAKGLYPKYAFSGEDWVAGEDPARPFRASRLAAVQVLCRNTRGLDYTSSVTFSQNALGHPQTSAVLGQLLSERQKGSGHEKSARNRCPRAAEPLQ